MRSSYDVAPATPPPLSLHPPPASTAFLTISKEHDNATLESPRRLKRRLDIAVGRLTTYQSQMRAQQQKRSRLHHKLEKMGIIIGRVKSKPDSIDILRRSFGGELQRHSLDKHEEPSCWKDMLTAFSFCDGI